MNNETAKELLTFIVNNHWSESPFSTPSPSNHVEMISLLDKIAELRGISKEDNGKEFNKIIDNKLLT